MASWRRRKSLTLYKNSWSREDAAKVASPAEKSTKSWKQARSWQGNVWSWFWRAQMSWISVYRVELCECDARCKIRDVCCNFQQTSRSEQQTLVLRRELRAENKQQLVTSNNQVKTRLKWFEQVGQVQVSNFTSRSSLNLLPKSSSSIACSLRFHLFVF